MTKLLVIDHEPIVLNSICEGLQVNDLDVVTATNATRGLEIISMEPPDALLVDHQLTEQSEFDLIEKIKALDPRLPIILMTACTSADTAIQAMKKGVYEYLLKPVDLNQLREIVQKATRLRRLSKPSPTIADPATSTELQLLVGQSTAMQEVYKAIGRFAPQDVTVLILGESGTGKELAARALHQHSQRSKQPFLAINCAAIPESLLESELFGHEKGAFTGADRQRIGKFEQAHQGTLFLDEIGDMSPATQAKVLRLLQNQQFERVGGHELISADVRLVAATNQNLDELVASGGFRQDLYYRLNGVTIHLPTLRERKSDIPLLIDHFIRLFNVKMNKSVQTLTPEAMNLLENHPWPGNIRELQNAIRFAVIQAHTDTITLDCLPTAITGKNVPIPKEVKELSDLRQYVRSLIAAGTPDLYRTLIRDANRVIFDEVMKHVKGNQVHASGLLNISRTTLRSTLEKIQKDKEE